MQRDATLLRLAYIHRESCTLWRQTEQARARANYQTSYQLTQWIGHSRCAIVMSKYECGFRCGPMILKHIWETSKVFISGMTFPRPANSQRRNWRHALCYMILASDPVPLGEWWHVWQWTRFYKMEKTSTLSSSSSSSFFSSSDIFMLMAGCQAYLTDLNGGIEVQDSEVDWVMQDQNNRINWYKLDIVNYIVFLNDFLSSLDYSGHLFSSRRVTFWAMGSLTRWSFGESLPCGCSFDSFQFIFSVYFVYFSAQQRVLRVLQSLFWRRWWASSLGLNVVSHFTHLV